MMTENSSDKYILIRIIDNDDGFENSICCLGIFENYYEAVGHMMEKIWHLQTMYSYEENSIFECNPIYVLNGNVGYGLDITYKKAEWKTKQKEHYYILTSMSETTNELNNN